MRYMIGANTPEDNRFKTISDFKWCIEGGGEVEFCMGKRVFGIFPKIKRTPEAPTQIVICEKYVENQEATELWYNTADESLEYLIDGISLRDIITSPSNGPYNLTVLICHSVVESFRRTCTRFTDKT